MNPDGTVPWRELLAEAQQRLESGGFESAADDARRIVAEAAGVEANELILSLDELTTERGVAHFDAMLNRRIGGEPLQYVLGSWGFRTLDLMVDRRVLIPRPETEMVVEFALERLDAIAAGMASAYMAGVGRAETGSVTVVDLGTGSGAIGLSIAAERVQTEVWLTDVSDDALAVARANIAGLGRAGARVSSSVGPWFDALPDHLRGTVSLIISNPPYVAASAPLPTEVQDWEPTVALRSGDDGLDDLRVIISGAGAWLTADGALVCEISPEQAEAARDIASAHFEAVEIRTDLTGRERAVVADRPRRS